MVGPLGKDVFDSGTPGLYQLLAPGDSHPVRLAIHVGENPESGRGVHLGVRRMPSARRARPRDAVTQPTGAAAAGNE